LLGKNILCCAHLGVGTGGFPALILKLRIANNCSPFRGVFNSVIFSAISISEFGAGLPKNP